MENYIPVKKGKEGWRRWDNLPHEGHWNDFRTEIYGTEVVRVIQDGLLASLKTSPPTHE